MKKEIFLDLEVLEELNAKKELYEFFDKVNKKEHWLGEKGLSISSKSIVIKGSPIRKREVLISGSYTESQLDLFNKFLEKCKEIVGEGVSSSRIGFRYKIP